MPAADWTLRLVPLTSPAGEAGAQPHRSSFKGRHDPELAGERGRRNAVEALGAIGNDVLTNWADVPSVVRLSDRTLAAHWLQENRSAADSCNLRLARSTDDGQTWLALWTPHQDGTTTQHGFASLFDTGNDLGLVWLDGCPVNGPALSASDRRVGVAWFTVPADEGHAFVAFSQDAGRTFSAPVRVDDTGSPGRVAVEQPPDGSAIARLP